MGRSAKIHKRISKKSQAQASHPPSNPQANTRPIASMSQVKRKSKLKAKAQAANSSQEPSDFRTKGESVLGGVDYVALMMGGRRKAREEANKMIED